MSPILLLKIKRILLLTETKLITSVLLAFIALMIEFSAVIIKYLENGSQTIRGTTVKKLSEYVVSFLQDLNNLPASDSIITGLFWATVGGFLYFTMRSIAKLIQSIEHEVVADINYTKGSVAKVLIRRLGSKVLVIFAFLIVFTVNIYYLIPFWMAMIGIFVYSGFKIITIGFFCIGFLGLTLSIYMVWITAYFSWFYEKYL